jgi:hypothetical protein
LAATGVAFVVTERLKIEQSPVFRTRVTKKFSPTCACATSRASIAFSLRHGDQVTMDVLTSDFHEVRHLITGKDLPAGPVRSVWNGRDDRGRLLPDANYRIRVHLADARWTITLPNVIRLDTTPPKITSFTFSPRIVSPDGDGNNDIVHVHYRVSERARLILFVDGKQNEQTRFRAGGSGKFDWSGLIDGRLEQGWHELSLKAVDTVGNVLDETEPTSVRVRILRVRPGRVVVRAGRVFKVGISTDRTVIGWKFAGTTGKAHHGSLTLRAPKTPGKYKLVVRSGHYKTGSLVVVK